MASPRLPIAVLSHHPETCGGWLMEHLRRRASVQLIRPFCGQPLPRLQAISGIVVLGSHHSVHDPLPALRTERQWLAKALASSQTHPLPNLGKPMPILGICFGAQLIAQIGGCHVFKGPFPEIGAHPITPAQGQSWLDDPLEVMQWHYDGIEGVPQGGQLVAAGQDAFPVQAFAWNHALALQFHPETTPGMVRRWTQDRPAEEARLQQELARLHAMRSWFSSTLDHLFSVSETAALPEMA